jgi:transposase
MIRLSDLQWERIRHHFPKENIADVRPGRMPVSTRQVLEGTLWILNAGAQWHILPLALAPSTKPKTNTKALPVFFFCGDLCLGDRRFNHRRSVARESGQRRALDSGMGRKQVWQRSSFQQRLRDQAAYPCAITAKPPTAK